MKAAEIGSGCSYTCHAGLVDFAAPIRVEGSIIGGFIGGQVRTAPLDENKIRSYARELGLDEESFFAAAKDVRLTSDEDIKKAADFISDIASAMSEIAYDSYKRIRKSGKLERLARSQASFMAEITANFKKSMQQWIETTESHSKNLPLSREQFKQLIVKGSDFLSAMEESAEYSRITGGDPMLNERFYDVRELLNGAVGKANVTNKKVTVKVAADDSVPQKLMGDCDRIEHIITKLLDNALKYTSEGTVEIKASCFKHSYATMLRLDVSDTGSGMTSERLGTVRDYLTNTVPYLDGTNVGISIVGFLARQMYGSVSVESELGRGTVFTVILPQLITEG
jgi:signal transduction histidine kinase